MRQVDDYSTRIFGRFQPLVAFVTVVSGLYIFATITQPLNIDSMNSLDGKPLPNPYAFNPPPLNATNHSNATLSTRNDFLVGPVVYYLFLCFGISSLIICLSVALIRRTIAMRGNGSARGAISLVQRMRDLTSRLRNLSPTERNRLQLMLSNRDFNGNDYESLLLLDASVSSRQRAASEEQIHRLPSHVYKSPEKTMSCSESLEEGGDSNTEDIDFRQCAICLETYQNGERLRTILCMHQFHEDCIDRWLRTSRDCPVCKQSAVE